MPIIEDVILRTKQRIKFAILFFAMALFSCHAQEQPAQQAPAAYTDNAPQTAQPVHPVEVPTQLVQPKPQVKFRLSYKQSACGLHETEMRFCAPGYEIGTDGCGFPLAIVLARSGSGLLNQYWRCQYGENPDEASGVFDLEKIYQGPCFEASDTLQADQLESLYLDGSATLDTLNPKTAIWLNAIRPVFDYIEVGDVVKKDTVKILHHYENCPQLWNK